MQHFTVTFLPDNKEVKIHPYSTVLEAAEQSGIVLNTTCGGKGTCGKCTVILPDGKEVHACMHKVESDLTVTIPDRSRYYKQKILEHGLDRDLEIQSPVIKRYVPSESLTDSLEDNLTAMDKNLADTVDQWKNVYKDMSRQQGITVTYHKDSDDSARIVSIEPGDTGDKLYGFAIDIGTTTVVAKLINLHNADVISVISITNPQIKFGDDVLSRINHAVNNGPGELHDDGSHRLRIVFAVERIIGTVPS